MPKGEILQAVAQWTPGIKPTWTIGEVRTALRLHAEGDFSQSAQLVDTMGEDDCLPGLYEKRADAVLGSEFSLEPVEQPNHQLSVRLADRFGPQWWDIFPESECSELLRWYRQLGVGLATLDWERGGSSWTARLRTLHPQFLRRDQQRNLWLYQSRDGELVVQPGDGRWILLVDGNRGWMHAGLRALAITWISKQLGLRDWNRYNERHGLPIIKAFAPAIAEEEDTLQFWEDVKGLQSETTAQLPTNLDGSDAKFDLDLLEAKDGNWETFKEILDRADRRFMVHVLGSNLSTEVSGSGSLAATKVHRGVEISKATADAEKLSTELRLQGLLPVIGYNVAASIDVIPWPNWDTAPPEDDEGNAKAAKTFGEALVQFSKAGYEVENLDELAERYHVKLKKAPKPEPAAPAADAKKPAQDDNTDNTDENDDDSPAPAA